MTPQIYLVTYLGDPDQQDRNIGCEMVPFVSVQTAIKETYSIQFVGKRKRTWLFLSIIILPVFVYDKKECEAIWPLWENAGCLHSWLEGVEHLSSVKETEERHGVWFVKCGTPPCIVSTTWGDIWHWQYGPVLRSPSSFSSTELCSIEALPAHSHANTLKAGADVKHLVLFLFTCKEIMCPVIIILLFCSSVCVIKKEFMLEAIFFGGLTSAACGRCH